MALGKGSEEGICSARECVEPAAFALIWSNPKIHRNREKTWLACANHLDFLRDYLAYRNFPARIVPFSELNEHPNC